MISYQILIILVLVTIIMTIPYLDEKNKFRLNLVTDGLLNKIVILSIIFFIILENYVIGLLCAILYFVILIETQKGSQTMEGFINYFK